MVIAFRRVTAGWAWAAALTSVMTLSAGSASAQALGGAERARPVAGDPGVSTMLVLDGAGFRVLRDYAEPGATRRLHSHDGATFHVFVLVTGELTLTVDNESPVEVTAGQVLSLKGGAKHSFKNTGGVTATIVEVFGKAPSAADPVTGLFGLLQGAAILPPGTPGR
jgi:quercetin dioxygenase-like cupin family protein